MEMLVFVFNSILLGCALAMDAFSVSIADGLREPFMSRKRMLGIAGTYAAFQFAMPVAGWFFVRSAALRFEAFRKLTPWISLFLLLFVGGKMIVESFRKNAAAGTENDLPAERLLFTTLMLQGVATSIDALSVGFTIAGYGAGKALACGLIIAVVTLAICMAGLLFGRRIGGRFSDKASLAGGLILCFIGLEIFLKG